MRTKKIEGDGGYNHGERFMRDDGVILTVGYIGRCWRYHISKPDGNRFDYEIAGRECDDIAGKLRRQFARGLLCG